MTTKNKIIVSLAIITGFTVQSYASPVTDYYAGAEFGAGSGMIFDSGNHKSAASTSFGLFAGIDIPVFRFEAEYRHIDGNNLHTNQAMINAYFKMISTVVHPYIGAGVGTIFGGHGIDDASVSTTAGYQGMLGLTFDLPAMPLVFDVEARALYVPDIYDFNKSPDLLNYGGNIKLRYVF